jgi:hypothetical protein
MSSKAICAFALLSLGIHAASGEFYLKGNCLIKVDPNEPSSRIQPCNYQLSRGGGGELMLLMNLDDDECPKTDSGTEVAKVYFGNKSQYGMDNVKKVMNARPSKKDGNVYIHLRAAGGEYGFTQVGEHGFIFTQKYWKQMKTKIKQKKFSKNKRRRLLNAEARRA